MTLPGLDSEAGDLQVPAAEFHAALDRLRALDDRQGRIAEMRLLCGASIEEIAAFLGDSIRRVEIDWRMAKRQLSAWLRPDDRTQAAP